MRWSLWVLAILLGFSVAESRAATELEELMQSAKLLSLSERQLQSKLSNNLLDRQTDLLKDLADSRSQQEVVDLMEQLRHGVAPSVAVAKLRSWPMTRFDLLQFLNEMKRVEKNDPGLQNTRRGLDRIKEEFAAKKWPLPSMRICSFALGSYITMRGFVQSYGSSFIDPENMDQFGASTRQFSATLLAGIAAFCISELYIQKGMLKEFPKEVFESFRNAQKVKNLEGLLNIATQPKSDVQLWSDAPLLSALGNSRIYDLLENAHDTYTDRLKDKLREQRSVFDGTLFRESWRDFETVGKAEEIFKQIAKKKSSERFRFLLNQATSKGNSPSEERELFHLATQVENQVRAEFKKFLQQSPKLEHRDLLNSFEENVLRARAKGMEDLKKRNIFSGLCYSSMGLSLGALGLVASIGKDASARDTPDDVWVREHRNQVFQISAMAIMSTCIAGSVYRMAWDQPNRARKSRSPMLRIDDEALASLLEIVTQEWNNRPKNSKGASAVQPITLQQALERAAEALAQESDRRRELKSGFCDVVFSSIRAAAP